MPLAFTLVEVAGGIVVFAIVVGPFLYVYASRQTKVAVVEAAWAAGPATISQTPSSGTFVWSVGQKLGGTTTPLAGRKTSIQVSPYGGARIVAMTDETGSTTYAGETLVYGKSDAAGNVSVTVEVDFRGAGSVVGVDLDAQLSDTHSFTAVP